MLHVGESLKECLEWASFHLGSSMRSDQEEQSVLISHRLYPVAREHVPGLWKYRIVYPVDGSGKWYFGTVS